jgi:predicted NBD/HSP70 family sugar kinase
VQTNDSHPAAQFPDAVSGGRSHANTQAIGLDLGGTKLYAGTTGPDGAPGASLLEPTEVSSHDGLFAQIVRLVEALRDERPNAFVVLGVPGAIDQTAGTLDLVPNIPFAPGCQLGEDLETALGIPVLLENDVNLAALAEARLGAGRNLDLVCFVSFGTGVGLGTVVDGRILRGANGRAGEIAYFPIAQDAFAAASRSEAGQFEDLVGTAALRQRYGGDQPDVRTLFARADGGDQDAAAAIAATAETAAVGLAGLQSLLDPDVVVIGGGFGMQKRFYNKLSTDAKRLLPFPMTMAQAELGPEAGLLGAIVLAGDAAGLPPLRFDGQASGFPAAPVTTLSERDAK